MLYKRKVRPTGRKTQVYVPEELEFTSLEIIFPLDSFELPERLSVKELIQNIRFLNDVYKSRKVIHKNGDLYYITDACVINKDGKAWWALEYSPCVNYEPVLEVKHTRTIEEFVDGRFTTQ